MRIMVFDVPAEAGGALTILNYYYSKAISDEKNEWIFVLGTPSLTEKKNIKTLNFPWIKKSWFHRLYFDFIQAPSLIKEYNVDKVLSLQNTIIPRTKVQQSLYLHQSLQFADKRYKINDNFLFWIYQNVVSKIVYSSVKKSDNVIVQTNWMKAAVIEKTGVDKEKIRIESPKLDIKISNKYSVKNNSEVIFFYPAGGMEYKNHSIILEASKLLYKRGIKDFKIVLTLNGDENDTINQIYKEMRYHNLKIKFIGELPQAEVYKYYSESVLLFPSYIESFGLPLLEAKMHGSPIIASDLPFANEILGNYPKVYFFDPFDYKDLAEKMLTVIRKVQHTKNT